MSDDSSDKITYEEFIRAVQMSEKAQTSHPTPGVEYVIYMHPAEFWAKKHLPVCLWYTWAEDLLFRYYCWRKKI